MARNLRAWANRQPPRVADVARILADNLRLAERIPTAPGFRRILAEQVERLALLSKQENR